MNKKIVFFDIDGTLIDEHTHVVPQSAINAIHKAQENGHILIVNTGRPSSALDSILREIGFDGFICGCGTYIEYKNEVVFHHTLDEKLCKEIVENIFAYNMQGIVESDKSICFRSTGTHPFFKESLDYYLEQGFPVCFFQPGDLLSFDKFVVFYNNIDDDIESFKRFAEKDFSLIQRSDTFIEWIPKPFSKASGIQYLIDYLGMTHEQTISIGDSTNDLPMLTYTKEAVAMGNSNPILFDKVTHITTAINDDGIANALKHFQLI